MPRTDESARPSSSHSTQYETVSSPMPPNSSGRAEPRKPADASLATMPRSMLSARSHSRVCGSTSRAANSRADCRISSCSLLSVKSTEALP